MHGFSWTGFGFWVLMGLAVIHALAFGALVALVKRPATLAAPTASPRDPAR